MCFRITLAGMNAVVPIVAVLLLLLRVFAFVLRMKAWAISCTNPHAHFIIRDWRGKRYLIIVRR